MAMANMNLIGVFVTKLWPVQALACGGDGGSGGATKNIIPPKFSNFRDIITCQLKMAITITTRIGVFARGQILDISPKYLQAGYCDAPGIMSAVS